MLYRIKNLTGDPTNADSAFWEGQKFYATSDRYQSLLPISPQETVIIGQNAFVELTQNAEIRRFIQILDTDGIEDTYVPYRLTVTLNNTWQYVDLARFAGNISLTNPIANGNVLWSMSGFSGSATEPPARTQSVILPGETLDISEPMSPIRFIYVKGASGSFYILSA